jgi:ATP-dependent Clp protease ATP-binding subunit ClpA
MWILHRCHNEPCCNPDHLYVGDAMDNAQDRMDRIAAEYAEELAFDRSGEPRPDPATFRQLNTAEIAALTGRRPALSMNTYERKGALSWRDRRDERVNGNGHAPAQVTRKLSLADLGFGAPTAAPIKRRKLHTQASEERA